MNPFPFRNRNTDLDRTIRKITEAIGTEGDTHGGGATSPKRNGAAAKRKGMPPQVRYTPTAPRVTEPLKISESHTRKELEGLPITRLRELKKKYEGRVLKGDRDAARELADIRGILRAKGAGVVVDEGAKPRTAEEWSAANRPSRETAKALQRSMARFRKRMAADGARARKPLT